MYTADMINPGSDRASNEVRDWLDREFGLKYGPADATAVIREDGRLIATGSRTGNVFKFFGISPSHQGENLSGILLNVLMDEAYARGIYHFFVFTGPDQARQFQGSGFREIICNEYAALLESGRNSINGFMASLKLSLGDPEGKRGAIVMNLNPMTRGHLFLIEEARSRVDELVIFLVEEDLSVFPFKDRLAILKAQVKDMPGVRAVAGGPYMVSRATFPTYFLKKADEDLPAYTTTDAGIFGKYYAKSLGITERFVGEEPLDPVTAAYNEALARELAHHGVALHIIPRKEEGGKPISASRVRRLLAAGNLEEAMALVPEATRAFLMTAAGKDIIDKIRMED